MGGACCWRREPPAGIFWNMESSGFGLSGTFGAVGMFGMGVWGVVVVIMGVVMVMPIVMIVPVVVVMVVLHLKAADAGAECVAMFAIGDV